MNMISTQKVTNRYGVTDQYKLATDSARRDFARQAAARNRDVKSNTRNGTAWYARVGQGITGPVNIRQRKREDG